MYDGTSWPKICCPSSTYIHLTDIRILNVFRRFKRVSVERQNPSMTTGCSETVVGRSDTQKKSSRKTSKVVKGTPKLFPHDRKADKQTNPAYRKSALRWSNSAYNRHFLYYQSYEYVDPDFFVGRRECRTSILILCGLDVFVGRRDHVITFSRDAGRTAEKGTTKLK